MLSGLLALAAWPCTAATVGLPTPVNIVGSYHRWMPFGSQDEREQPNTPPVVHLINPVDGSDVKATVTSGSFHYSGLWPGRRYYLALVDNYRYWNGFRGQGWSLGSLNVGWFSPDPALGATDQQSHPVAASQQRVQIGAHDKFIDVKASWHVILEPPQQGSTFAVQLDASNRDKTFSDDLKMDDPTKWHSITVVATDE